MVSASEPSMRMKEERWFPPRGPSQAKGGMRTAVFAFLAEKVVVVEDTFGIVGKGHSAGTGTAFRACAALAGEEDGGQFRRL